LNLAPTLPFGNPFAFKVPSNGTYPIAILVFFSGCHHGDVTNPTGFPPSPFDINQKSGA
jgi:hypothetical protein